MWLVSFRRPSLMLLASTMKEWDSTTQVWRWILLMVLASLLVFTLASYAATKMRQLSQRRRRGASLKRRGRSLETHARLTSRGRGRTMRVWKSSRVRKEASSLSSRRLSWKLTRRSERRGLRRLSWKTLGRMHSSNQALSIMVMAAPSIRRVRASYRHLAIYVTKSMTASSQKSGFIRGQGTIAVCRGSSSSQRLATYYFLLVMTVLARSGIQRLTGSAYERTRVTRKPCVTSATLTMGESSLAPASTNSSTYGTPRQAKSFAASQIVERHSA